MPKTNTVPITQSIKNYCVTIANSDGFIPAAAAAPFTNPTNVKKLLTAGAEGSVVKSLTITSDSTAAHIVQLWLSLNAGTTDFLLCSVNVPIGAGFLSGTTVNIDVLAAAVVAGFPTDQSGRPTLELQASAELYVGVTIAAVTANKTIYIQAMVEDY